MLQILSQSRYQIVYNKNRINLSSNLVCCHTLKDVKGEKMKNQKVKFID